MKSRYLLLAAAVLMTSTVALAGDVSSDRHAAAQTQRKAVSNTDEARALAHGALESPAPRACECRHR